MTGAAPTRKEMELMYNRSEHVIRRWLRKAGITHRQALTPQEFEKFKAVIGLPVRSLEAVKSAGR